MEAERLAPASMSCKAQRQGQPAREQTRQAQARGAAAQAPQCCTASHSVATPNWPHAHGQPTASFALALMSEGGSCAGESSRLASSSCSASSLITGLARGPADGEGPCRGEQAESALPESSWMGACNQRQMVQTTNQPRLIAASPVGLATKRTLKEGGGQDEDDDVDHSGSQHSAQANPHPPVLRGAR